MAVTEINEWRPGPDLSSRFRTIRRWYSLEVLGMDKAMNQESFASLAGFGAKAWAAWETGRNEPDDLEAVARQLRDVIGLDPHYLLDGTTCDRCGGITGMTCFLHDDLAPGGPTLGQQTLFAPAA